MGGQMTHFIEQPPPMWIQNLTMKEILLLILFTFLGLMMLPVLFYGVGDLLSAWNRIYVKDEFYIEYLEMYASVSLWNGSQGFVGNVSEAYWNNDSLVVSGDGGCFLIEFGKTKYNDEMIEINCGQLGALLKNKPLENFLKE